ncbi:hypothetical protein IC213_13085 [Clostridioides sp. ES-S-0049-02]|uniref:hypothetical protein n=1 Tax=Clostridioides sp. ES-S-0049-02 TaxID=2770778 RepID=UPI001D10D1E9|nr:hypothetical protein [Clostridioides sp. ES-S-0049-02]
MNYYKDKREGFRGYGGPHRHPWNHVCEGCKIFEMMCHEGFGPRGYEGGHGNREYRGHEGFAPSGHERTYREFKENEEFDAKNYQENNEYQKCGRFENQNVDEKIVSENKSDTEKNNIKEYEKIYESKTVTDEQVEEVNKNNTKEEIKGEKKDTDKK